MRIVVGVQPSLHVVGYEQSPLMAALKEQLGNRVRVRSHSLLPSIRSLQPGDLLVIDLGDTRGQAVPHNILPFLQNHEVWLTYGDRLVSAQWLGAVQWPKLHFVQCSQRERVSGFRSLIASLIQRLMLPAPADISSMVLLREPPLNTVSGLVKAVCEHPWDVRHPSQLAEAVGMRLSKMKEALRELGFTRVEHFITYVRWVAFEQLVGVRGTRVCVARDLTGIADVSNQRRQLARARRRSLYRLA